MRPNHLETIQNRIKSSEAGSIFVPSDFSDITEKVNINMTLKRLMDEGTIRRIMRGVYDCPRYSQLLQEYAAPDLNAVAAAIARNHNWSIVPCGDTALNLLGLSTQVPAVYHYISDGPYRAYEVGTQQIQFKHTTQKNITGLSPRSALVIQALKAIGETEIDTATIEKLQSILSTNEKQCLLSEAQQSTAWIYRIIKQICQKDVS